MHRHFQYKIEVFPKEIMFDGPLGKKKYYVICIDLKGVPHMIICLYGFSIHQILKMNLSILILLKK